MGHNSKCRIPRSIDSHPCPLEHLLVTLCHSWRIIIQQSLILLLPTMSTAQKFVSDVANDALTFSRMRGAGHSKKKSSEKRYTLTMEDLAPALNEYGVNVKKPHYFT